MATCLCRATRQSRPASCQERRFSLAGISLATCQPAFDAPIQRHGLGDAAVSRDGDGDNVARLIVNRSTAANTGVDVVSLVAKNAKVFSISVRPTMPYGLAARSRYNGYAGRLARITTTTQLDKMNGLRPDVAGWIDGASETGFGGTFKSSAGTSISSGLFGDELHCAASSWRTCTYNDRVNNIAPRPRSSGNECRWRARRLLDRISGRWRFTKPRNIDVDKRGQRV